MSNESARRKITLGWKPELDQLQRRDTDDYVMVDEPRGALVKTLQLRKLDSIDDGVEDRFEKRMVNWRATIRGGRGTGHGCCATWARWYVIIRNLGEDDGVKRFEEPDLSSVAATVTVDELDGWIIEAAVRSLPIYEERKVLHYHYVWNYPERWIRNKLHLRSTSVKLVMARAQTNLKKILRNLESPANILFNKFHAGTDPRLESKDALSGAALTLKNEALTD